MKAVSNSPRSLLLAGVFLDPYERINVWSHALPGLCFLLLGWVVESNMVLGLVESKSTS